MKSFFTLILIFFSAIHFNCKGQENHGNTFNLGVGLGGYSGYYGYLNRFLPVLHADYEFSIVKDFTLAPFVNFYTYTNQYYWGDANNPPDNYTYREIVLPIGVKGTYYFDELVEATDDWDFYLAGSLGLAFANSRWESGYRGDKNYYRGGRSTFLDIHVGAEYHLNKKMGLFLDVSSGVSTIGLAFH